MSVIKQSYTSKKTGKTRITYYATQWHPVLKKKICGKSRTNKKDAKKDDAKLVLQIEQEIKENTMNIKRNESKQLLFDTVYQKWITASSSSYADNTVRIYKDYYKRYLKDVFGDVSIANIESEHILNFKYCMESGDNPQNYKYGPETINKCINLLCNIFNFAISPLKIIDSRENPMIGIKRNRTPYKVKNVWTDKEIALFLQSEEAKTCHYYVMFCCQILLGSRPSETCGLAETDYLEEQQQFTMHRSYNKYNVLEEQMKGSNSYRSVYIPNILNNLVKQKLLWKKRMRLQYPDFFNNDFLFVKEDGSPVNPDNLSKHFKKILKLYNQNHEEKLTDISLYDCRHSFATNNYEHGESDKVLSEIMGNSPKTFLARYAHIRGNKKKETLDIYEDIIFNTGTKK